MVPVSPPARAREAVNRRCRDGYRAAKRKGKPNLSTAYKPLHHNDVCNCAPVVESARLRRVYRDT